jgi:hypothetical protein
VSQDLVGSSRLPSPEAKVLATSGLDNEERADLRSDAMAFVYSCDCGYVARADTAVGFVADVERHISDTHPDMVGKLDRDDILALAEEV